MYVPTGDLFLVLTFVHKWDAWVILPLLSKNIFIASLIFPCITHFLGSFLLHCYSTVFEEWLISIIYHFSDKSRNFTRSGLQVSSDFLVQWRPKKLGTVWRKTLLRTLLLMSIFWSALGSFRRDPTPPPPPAMLWPPMLRKIQLCLVGGEVSLVLLISLERSQHFWPSLWLYSSNEKRRKIFLVCEVIGILKINYCQTFKWAMSVEILFVPWLNPVLLRVHLEWLILYIYVSCQIVSQKWFVTSDTLRPFGLASYLPCLETKLVLSFSVVFFS